MSSVINQPMVAREVRVARILVQLNEELYAAQQWHSQLLMLVDKLDRAGIGDDVLNAVEEFLNRDKETIAH
jgi:hypothetical protein